MLNVNPGLVVPAGWWCGSAVRTTWKAAWARMSVGGVRAGASVPGIDMG